jgi:N-acetylglutamate synthase-like GNAT family acetyltransferase
MSTPSYRRIALPGATYCQVSRGGDVVRIAVTPDMKGGHAGSDRMLKALAQARFPQFRGSVDVYGANGMGCYYWRK